ncbi:DUF935 family protein [uncultured Tateyamaria sp.]|uniref:phage portal protein family protein n=1 Tax=uncultured Tateyamaria sp. TaxID=455651 RepID=UPI0026205872|nr:DUF935 family protein [uncultured Tateyamaria sp.]
MRTDEPDLKPTERKNLPTQAKTLIANARNDITIPYFSGALRPVDDTLLARGGGKGLKIYDEIERDTHAYAMLQKRRTTLVAREWEVIPASDAPQDIKAADIVKAQLEALPFDKICEDLLDSLLKGFAVSEIVWARRDSMIAANQVPSHDQRRFVFDEDWRPRLLTFANILNGEELPDRKFIVHRHGVKGNNPYGLGLGTRLFWATLFKREGITFWLHFIEKFAGPTVVGETPYGTLDEEQNKLLETLKQVRQSSAMTLPIGTNVKFLEATRSGTVSYAEWCAYWDKQISICVTGETLTTDIGNAGSKAASQTHESILEKLVDSDSDLLSDTLQETLCQWIVDYNVPGAGVPRVERVRAKNEKDEADVRDKQAKAAEARDKALRRALTTAAMIQDDELARAYMVSTGLADDMPEEVLIALVEARSDHRPDPDAAQPPARFADDPALPKKKVPHHVCLSEPNSPLMILADQIEIASEGHFQRRIEAIRKAVDADTSDLASQNLLVTAANWTPNVQGRLLELAIEVAALQGREEVFAEADGASREPAFMTEVTPQVFQEQVDFLRQKRGQPTERWTDLMRGGHDRAFAVAGATDMAMIDDFQQAILQAAETWDKKAFARDFDRIVEKYGWSYNGGRTWRIRTIFETNLRTSFMAGRLAQMRDPDVVRLRPFWQYKHGDTGTPKNPRPHHLAWDGLVLMHDDPWWDVHFPPNDWLCSCGVDTLSRGDMRRMGKEGPDQTPQIIRDLIIDRATGQPSDLPRGIGYGWDYQPGNIWERGLVPNASPDEQTRAHAVVRFDLPSPAQDLFDAGRPSQADRLALDAPVPDAVSAFLDPFGASLGRAVPFEDRAGHLLTISDQLFRAGAGDLIVLDDLLPWLAHFAEVIRDPDEIWLGFTNGPDGAHEQVDRRYVRVDPLTGFAYLFVHGDRFWRALRLSLGEADALDELRQGKRLWGRGDQI